MTVTLLNGQLKITLTESETVKYNIDRVFCNCDSPTSGDALLKLLKLAVLQVDFQLFTSQIGRPQKGFFVQAKHRHPGDSP